VNGDGFFVQEEIFLPLSRIFFVTVRKKFLTEAENHDIIYARKACFSLCLKNQVLIDEVNML
jgi:hypothetical protein